ncbi:MAG TPA: hypothetical protein VM124_02345 [Candidatus Limnocylindrales bacterium]|nr:hypothetical protein [Candidatus Limnocylindrales bacterium]
MGNKLKSLAEFQAVLTHYRLSGQSKQILAQSKLVLLVAPSAGGRNTIIQELLTTGDYYFVVSDTTRQPRVNNGVLERNGREYWFRTEEEMLQDLKQGKFLEAEIIHGQQVSGISIRELQKASNNNKIAITDVDIGGISNIVEAKPDTIAIAVLPPSFAEWQQRLSVRGPIEVGEYKRRMQTACRIFEQAVSHSKFAFVINDNLQHAVEQIDHIAKKGMTDIKKHNQARQLARKLLQETQAAISNL